jgi:hypothetical protein
VWQAELPTSENDAYMEAEWRDGKLTAFSWSCFAVELDVTTGRIHSRLFTK